MSEEKYKRIRIEELIEELKQVRNEYSNIPVGFDPREIEFENHVKTITDVEVEQPSGGSWHIQTAKLKFVDDY